MSEETGVVGFGGQDDAETEAQPSAVDDGDEVEAHMFKTALRVPDKAA